MEKFKLSVHHSRNPLHLYCHLVEAGTERRVGLLLSRFYEKTVFRII
ncbi:MAG: hypothetical protein OS130_08395 [Thermodesulfobacteriota bacterium]|nr:MAG: hypothetical protein OS130_08395 [Thermodesulfobacteriota bacterium]